MMLRQGGDEFNSATLKPQWEWDYQPRANEWSLTERPGFLRLHAVKQLQPGPFFKTGDVLNQRYLRSNLTLATIKVDFSRMADGQETGLTNYNGGKNYATLSIVQKDGVKTIKYEEDGTPTPGDRLPPIANNVWLRSTIGFDGVNGSSYSTDGRKFTPFGGSFNLNPGGYRGDMIGIYTFNNASKAGYIDVDFFHNDVQNR